MGQNCSPSVFWSSSWSMSNHKYEKWNFPKTTYPEMTLKWRSWIHGFMVLHHYLNIYRCSPKKASECWTKKKSSWFLLLWSFFTTKRHGRFKYLASAAPWRWDGLGGCENGWWLWWGVDCAYPMTDPWDWYICLHEWLIFMVNVGKYTSPMDPMGLGFVEFSTFKFRGITVAAARILSPNFSPCVLPHTYTN